MIDERYRHSRAYWVARLRATLQARQSGGDIRPARVILADILERLVEQGLARRQAGRIYFRNSDDDEQPRDRRMS